MVSSRLLQYTVPENKVRTECSLWAASLSGVKQAVAVYITCIFYALQATERELHTLRYQPQPGHPTSAKGDAAAEAMAASNPYFRPEVCF